MSGIGESPRPLRASWPAASPPTDCSVRLQAAASLSTLTREAGPAHSNHQQYFLTCHKNSPAIPGFLTLAAAAVAHPAGTARPGEKWCLKLAALCAMATSGAPRPARATYDRSPCRSLNVEARP